MSEAASPSASSVRVSPLAVRDFRVYWVGQLVSLTGFWMQAFANGLLLMKLTPRGTDFGLINLVATLPMMLLAPIAGPLADRFDRRKIVMISQAALGLMATTVGLLVWRGDVTLPLLYALSVISGTIAAFDFPALQALVPSLVPPNMIGGAIAMNQAIFHGTRAIGPAVGGVLVAAAGLPAAFFANAISYLAVIYGLSIIPSRPIKARASGDKGGLGEAIRFIGGDRTLIALFVVTTLSTVFLLPIFAVFIPKICVERFGADEMQMGMVMSGSGLGAVLGSLAVMKVPPAVRGRLIVGAAGLAATSALLLSYVRSPWVGAVTLVPFNFATALGFGLSATIIQTITPDRLRGRVMALYAITFTGLMPVFALLWGVIMDATSLVATLRGLAIAYGVGAAAVLAVTGIWNLREAVPAEALTPGGSS